MTTIVETFFLAFALLHEAPTTTAFQSAAPITRPPTRHSQRLTTLSVSQQLPRVKKRLDDDGNGDDNDKVDSFVFFNDFDYDHYQTVQDDDNDDNTAPTSLSLLQDPASHCAVDPSYADLSSAFVSRMDSESTFLDYTSDGLCVPAGRVGRWKEEIANVLNEPAVEIVIASVVLLNSLLVALSTVNELSPFMPMIYGAEIVVSTIFVVDFAARWFSSSRDTGKFVLCPQFVLDLLVVIVPLAVTLTPDWIMDEVAFLPPALSKPSELFNLRLLRVLSLQRFLQNLDTFERFIEQVLGRTDVRTNIVQEWQLQLARVVSSLFTLLSVVSGLIYTAENSVNPNISNYFDALYFSLTTRKSEMQFEQTVSIFASSPHCFPFSHCTSNDRWIWRCQPCDMARETYCLCQYCPRGRYCSSPGRIVGGGLVGSRTCPQWKRFRCSPKVQCNGNVGNRR